MSRQPGWSATGASSANAAMDVQSAGSNKQRRTVKGYNVVVSGAVVGASDITVTVKYGSTVMATDIIGAGAARGANCGASDMDLPASEPGQTISLTATAGGASVVCTGTIWGHVL